MKTSERKRGLIRAPKLIWEILFRGRYSFVYDQMSIRREAMTLLRRINVLKAGMNFIYRAEKPWNMPLHVQVELTNYCNLHCPVCPTGSGVIERKPRAMSPGLFEKFMEEMGPYLLTMSLWAWGEPLLHPQLREILRIAGEHSVITFLSTNGQNLDNEKIVKAILDFPPTYLIVAIDGLTDDSNSKYRVGARLDRILAGVHRIREERSSRKQESPILHMRYMVMKHNQHELTGVVDFAKENGFDFLTFRDLSPISVPFTEARFHEFIPDEREYRGYHVQGNVRFRRDDFICQHPFWFPTLFADGTVVACCEDYNASHAMGIYDKEASFRDVWYGKKAGKVRNIVRKNPDLLSFCKACPERDRGTTDTSVRAVFLNDRIPRVTAKRG